MWIQMGQTWASMFELLEPSSTPDAEADCATISAADVAADPPATASSLEVRIPTDLVIQRLRGCTVANALGLMGRNCKTWTMRGMETVAWDNCHHPLLQLQTVWAYWVVAAFYHCLPL